MNDRTFWRLFWVLVILGLGFWTAVLIIVLHFVTKWW